MTAPTPDELQEMYAAVRALPPGLDREMYRNLMLTPQFGVSVTQEEVSNESGVDPIIGPWGRMMYDKIISTPSGPARRELKDAVFWYTYGTNGYRASMESNYQTYLETNRNEKT